MRPKNPKNFRAVFILSYNHLQSSHITHHHVDSAASASREHAKRKNLKKGMIIKRRFLALQIKRWHQNNGKLILAFCDGKKWFLTSSGPVQSYTRPMKMSVI
jgi:hypothetical protein